MIIKWKDGSEVTGHQVMQLELVLNISVKLNTLN